MAALNFDAIINSADWNQKLTDMERRALGMTQAVTKGTSEIDSAFSSLATAAVGYFSFTALAQLPAQLIKVRGEFQQLEVAFSTMLRSKDRADALLGEIKAEALKSPFTLQDIATGAKQLLAYGSSAETVVSELRTLGDVASGVSAPIGDLVYLYGTLRAQGRAYSIDIRQFASRGIPIYAELATVLGVAKDKVLGLVTAGKVGFPEVEQAFKNMSGAGGIFEGLMEKQAHTLTGLASNLKDAYGQMLNEIGKSIEGPVGAAMQGLTALTKNYKSVINIVTELAAVYGTYRAALAIVSIAEQIELSIAKESVIVKIAAGVANETLTVSQIRGAAVTNIMARAQLALNAALNINPFVAMATVIAALATAYFVFNKEAVKVKTAQDLLTGVTGEVNEKVKDQKAEVILLIAVLHNQNVAESERLKAYERLKSISPDIVAGLDFQRAKTNDLTAAVNTYIATLEKSIRIEAVRGKIKEAVTQELSAQDTLKAKQDALIKLGGSKATKAGQFGDSGQQALLDQTAKTRAQLDVDAAVTAVKTAQKTTADLNVAYGAIYTAGSNEALNAEKKRLETLQRELPKTSKGYKDAEDSLRGINEQIKAQTAAHKENNVVVNKGIADLEAEIKLKKESLGTGNSDAKNAQIRKEIAALEKQKRDLEGKPTGTENAAAKAAAKAAEKIGPEGSESFYANEVKKAEEALKKTTVFTSEARIETLQRIRDNAQERVDAFKLEQDFVKGSAEYYEKVVTNAQARLKKLPAGNTADIVRLQATIVEATEKGEVLKKQIAVKSYDEELADKKTKYELFQKYVDFYGQESADAQFGKLKESGATYAEFLDSEIKRLEAKQANGKLDEKGTAALVDLTGQRRVIDNVKTPIEIYTADLERAKQAAGSLTAYLAILEVKQKALEGKPRTEEYSAQRLLLATQIQDAEQQRRDQLRNFLQGVAGSEAEAEAIRAKYRDQRTELDKTREGKTVELYNREVLALEKAQKEETENAAAEAFKQSDAYKALNDVIEAEGIKALVVQRQRIKKALADKTADNAKELDDYKKLQKDLRDIDREIALSRAQNLQKYASLIGDIGSALSSMGGDAGRAGTLISALSVQFNSLSKLMEKANSPKGLSTEEAVSAGLGAAGTIITTIIDNTNQRRAAERQFYLEVNAQQSQYNLLLNEELGLKTKKRSNVFVTDLIGEIKDGLTKYDDAQKKYLESLTKLQAGRVKTGLKDVIDTGSVLKLAGSGALIGTALLPGIGTVVGGIVGGLIGLFGGATKKADQFANLLKTYPALLQTGADGVERINVALAESLINNNLLDDSTKLLVQDTLAYQKAMEAAKQQIKDVVGTLAGSLGNSLRDALVGAFKEGTSAARAFGDSVSNVLENILSQIIFNAVFGKQFDELQKQLTDSFSGVSGKSTVDVLGDFFKNAPADIQQFNDALNQANAAALGVGLTNVFRKGPPVGGTLAGSIKGVSEETAGVLSGQLNAIRIMQAGSQLLLRDQLFHLANIDYNTLTSVVWLKSIDNRLEILVKDPLRPKGF